jgi:hypothetical protein
MPTHQLDNNVDVVAFDEGDRIRLEANTLQIDTAITLSRACGNRCDGDIPACAPGERFRIAPQDFRDTGSDIAEAREADS